MNTIDADPRAADKFRGRVRRVAVLTGVLGVIHVVMPIIAYTGSNPIVKVGDDFARWDVVNAGIVLGLVFLCMTAALWSTAPRWNERDHVTEVLTAGIAIVLAIDAVYLLVDPTPAPDHMEWTSFLLAAVLAFGAAEAAGAALMAHRSPSPRASTRS